MATWRYPGRPDSEPVAETRPPAIPVKVGGTVVGYAEVIGNDDYGITIVCRITKPLPVRYQFPPGSTFSFRYWPDNRRDHG